MKKKLLSLLLVATLVLLTACGGGDKTDDTQSGDQTSGSNTQTSNDTNSQGNSDNTTDSGKSSINWDEHTTYTWWMMATFGDWWSDYNGNPVLNYLQDRYNVTIKVESPVAGTEADSLSLMMGTGNYTDVFSLAQYSGSIPQLFEEGIILDIAEWLDYMPNLTNMLETNSDFNKSARDDNGRILTFPVISDESELTWAGLMYRHDILETMTGDNVKFPSGKGEPTTLADWEYMLPLMKEYFEMAGYADYAPLIIPATGIIGFGEIASTFNAPPAFYVRNNVVSHGLYDSGTYDYVSTMRDWYQKGWIHQDFASRTDDMFFMPNPQLVFSGGAGVFYGMMMHLGDRMSIPDAGLMFDVRPIPSPIIEGVSSQKDMMRRGWDLFGGGISNAIYSGAKNVDKLVSIIDLMYSDEGALLNTIGLLKEQIPSGYDIMDKMGMADGAFWYDANGNIELNPKFQIMGGDVGFTDANGVRFPGYQKYSITNNLASEEALNSQRAWGGHDAVTEVFPLPASISLTVEEANIISANNARITDHYNQHMSMFIMGTLTLNEDTWAEFVEYQRSQGLDENLAIQQAAYGRYLNRGN